MKKNKKKYLISLIIKNANENKTVKAPKIRKIFKLQCIEVLKTAVNFINSSLFSILYKLFEFIKIH